MLSNGCHKIRVDNIAKMFLLYGNNGQANFFKVRKSQIREFFDSFHYRKSANFLYVSVYPSQNPQTLMVNPQVENRKFLENTAQLCLKTVLRVFFKNLTL